MQQADSTTTNPARQRLAELLWYADHNIALPEEELAEVEHLAQRFGVKLEWKEGRGEGN